MKLNVFIITGFICSNKYVKQVVLINHSGISSMLQKIFIYSNEEDVARIFLFYFNKICNMFLSKVQQSYCYTELCNYREEFVFKPISIQFNIFLGCNLNFTRSFNASHLEMDG